MSTQQSTCFCCLDDLSYGLNTLGPLCLWQCFSIEQHRHGVEWRNKSRNNEKQRHWLENAPNYTDTRSLLLLQHSRSVFQSIVTKSSTLYRSEFKNAHYGDIFSVSGCPGMLLLLTMASQVALGISASVRAANNWRETEQTEAPLSLFTGSPEIATALVVVSRKKGHETIPYREPTPRFWFWSFPGPCTAYIMLAFMIHVSKMHVCIPSDCVLICTYKKLWWGRDFVTDERATRRFHKYWLLTTIHYLAFYSVCCSNLMLSMSPFSFEESGWVEVVIVHLETWRCADCMQTGQQSLTPRFPGWPRCPVQAQALHTSGEQHLTWGQPEHQCKPHISAGEQELNSTDPSPQILFKWLFNV